ncbi:MAG: NAD-dependent epimerase/dehydratase [Paracoccaceae bacterium]|nr:NAD-dependent epimerase/dehydratase [Paracoccaceae bacterium]
MDFLTDPFLVSPHRFDGPVLVTGAGGCIGAWVVSVLTRSGVQCVAADLHDNRARPALILGEDASAALDWETCDVTDGAAVGALADRHGIRAIIHLAGLQVPFCAANPALGARVNVEGTINIFQAARNAGIKRTVYASSVASVALTEGDRYKATLYGAYKLANEQTARIYWDDWGVPAVGLRPNVVYGVGRDQGMSSLTTAAIHAAALVQDFEIPYTGPYSWLYAGEAAAAFIAAVSQDGAGAHVFDLNGRCETIEKSLSILQGLENMVQVSAEGDEFPFPPDLDEAALRAHVPAYAKVSLEEGIAATYRAFKQLASENRLPPLPA